MGENAPIKEFMEDRGHYFLATEETDTENRKRFPRMMCGDLGMEGVTFDDWGYAFSASASDGGGRRNVIVLDEFQHLAQADAAFPSKLQPPCPGMMDPILSEYVGIHRSGHPHSVCGFHPG